MNFAVLGSAHGHIMGMINGMIREGCRFVGIWDDKTELSKNIVKEFSVKLYEDQDELLNEDIQIAATAAVNNEKIDIIEKCAKKNVHVIADKPIVISMEGYSRLEKVISEGKIQVGLVLSLRYVPEIYTLKELIKNGELGTLTSVEIFNPHKLSPSTRPEWFFERDKNGGTIIDLSVHSIDLFHWLADSETDEFFGVTQKSMLGNKPEFYDSMQFMAVSKNGVTGYFRSDWHIPSTHWAWGDVRIFCSGSRGIAEIRAVGDPLSRERVLILMTEGGETRRAEIRDFSLSPEADFINRIKLKPFLVGHNDILTASLMAAEFDNRAKRLCL